MLFEQSDGLCARPVPTREPVGQLPMPDQRVPTHLHAVCLRKCNQRIRAREAVFAAGWLQPAVLHVVFRSQYAEFAPKERAVSLAVGTCNSKTSVHRATNETIVPRHQCAKCQSMSI